MNLSLVLTSRQNFSWLSMQEIIPMLEACWQASCDSRHEVRVINVDALDSRGLRSLARQALGARNLVLACFTPKLARIARALRERFGVDARFITHLHNQATIGSWPLRIWGPAFRTDDVFVSSCTADANAMRRVAPEARIEIVPFCLNETVVESTDRPSHLPRALAYVGRISPQKNLHTLLVALTQVSLPLEVFGGEDHLGSPNMGIEHSTYAQELLALVKKLNLAERVRFHGHLPREAIAERLRELPHVFVSPSLHSDENFGMAAFRALTHGMPAVLSDWGGHRDLARSFSDQVLTVKVRASWAGPWISANDLAYAMARASERPMRPFHLPSVYRPAHVSARFRDIATRESGTSFPLRFSELADQILARRERLLAESPRQSKIFSSYADPLARPLFEAYGMEETGALSAENLPWVHSADDTWTVHDPHRGTFRFTGASEACLAAQAGWSLP